MKKITFTLSIFLFLGLTNLQAQKSASQEPKKETTARKKTEYAIVISFISIGGGIDGVSLGRIDSLIKNNPKKLTVETMRTGREGENTMSLELKELSKTEKKEFIEKVEKLIVNKDLVKIQKDVVVKTVPAKY
jgi:hypothetical protein